MGKKSKKRAAKGTGANWRLIERSYPDIIHIFTPLQQARCDPYVKYLDLVIPKNGDDGSGSATLPEESHRLKTAPLFSSLVHQKTLAAQTFTFSKTQLFSQYGLLGLMRDPPTPSNFSQMRNNPQDKLVFTNTAEPWSTFICGSQGSGKSHTLSCLLENYLLADPRITVGAKPLTGMVFHYDKFSSFNSGQVCEAAYLCSAGVRVKVLVAPTSIARMSRQYANLPGLPENCPRPKVLPLVFGQEQLSVDVMMTLMAVHDTGVTAPLYICAIRQLLRDIAMDNQSKGLQGFDYMDFRHRLSLMSLTDAQNAPLDMRLQLLQSSMIKKEQTSQDAQAFKETWAFEPGSLTIVDLSDQFVNESDACALFSICLKLFMQGWQTNPRVVALDEAHRFLTSTSEAMQLQADLIAIIRQQRHLGSRMVIATQEPTVSGELLDLCNVTIVHRFNSPHWYKTIKQHLAAANADHETDKNEDLFSKIVKLSTGEAFMFCPTATVTMEAGKAQTLQDRFVKMKTRARISADGGQSIQTTHKFTTATKKMAYIPNYQRMDLPSLASQATKGKPRVQHSAVGVPPAPHTQVPVPVVNGSFGGGPYTPPLTRSGQKRPRTTYDGSVDA
ncbi:hypothetical protein LTR05_003677 [Lithohypha guttulata]|uniref:AAA+ ATPase domain-containing protein n=1 Tax=Lithohypha guttulata TaxID=1690604 RepID=A0AAN7T1Z8_9EURO|nr:hypothetical protein LTR05_003677 [Lithohypha guttulata]